MTKSKGSRNTGDTACKCCLHPGIAEINALLLNGTAKYPDIIRRMKASHPGAPLLNTVNISRHKIRHLMTKPIMVTSIDEVTGDQQQGYIIGHLSQAPIVPKEAIPAKDQRIGIEDALWIIINTGLRNAVQNPESVSIKDVTAALELARKFNIKPEDGNDFNDAWKALGKKKASRTKTTKVTVEETLEEDGEMGEPPRGEVIEGSVVSDGWSEAEILLLEAPPDGNTPK